MAREWLPASEYVPKNLSKLAVEENVYEMALRRIRHVYDTFDHVQVSFSGGKDSTLVLNLALIVARERGKLPLDVVFWDEEAIHPETIEYVNRVRQNPEISLRWLCLPVKHVNACSPKSPFWYPWAEEDREIWCRPRPDYFEVVTELAGFSRLSLPDSHFLTIDPADGTTAVLTGIRADESLTRYRGVVKRENDNYISWREPEKKGGTLYAWVKPVYDWTTPDVWIAPKRFGWDYNHTYDKLEMFGVPRVEQRVAPPFGEQPMRNLFWYQACFPELWDTMVNRVPGAATAARYSASELYSYGKQHLPEGRTWRELVPLYIARHGDQTRRLVAQRIEREIKKHVRYSKNAPIHETTPHELTGISWKWLAKIAHRGDYKNRSFAKIATAKGAKSAEPETEPEGEEHEI